jgi:hypothetical protein
VEQLVANNVKATRAIKDVKYFFIVVPPQKLLYKLFILLSTIFLESEKLLK